MPTVMHVGPYRLFFVSIDMGEPPHVHVQRDRMVAKFWLDPVALESAGGFRPHEINEIGRIVMNNHDQLLEHWNGFFHH